jgi:hypothetical protein
MVVTGGVEQVQSQINRLKRLGYSITAIEPPLDVGR